MKNNIIIVDLDRTLLHTDKSVSDYTIQTLKKCKNNVLWNFKQSPYYCGSFSVFMFFSIKKKFAFFLEDI